MSKTKTPQNAPQVESPAQTQAEAAIADSTVKATQKKASRMYRLDYDAMTKKEKTTFRRTLRSERDKLIRNYRKLQKEGGTPEQLQAAMEAFDLFYTSNYAGEKFSQARDGEKQEALMAFLSEFQEWKTAQTATA
jgi:hypothetical protein